MRNVGLELTRLVETAMSSKTEGRTAMEWNGARSILSVDLQEEVGKKNENRKGQRLTEVKYYRKVQKQKASEKFNH